MKKLLYSALITGIALNASGQTLVGITVADQVFTIPNASTPFLATAPVAITGLDSFMTVAGADFRPNTGELFILGHRQSNDSARLYTLNYMTGVATGVGTGKIKLSLGTGSVGFDFNPTVDRIRVVGANDSNYRLNPLNGTIAAKDGAIFYATGDPNAAANPSIGAVAYTNSFIGSEATTLYDYDESLNVFSTQNPPNNGQLNTISGLSGIVVNTASRTTDMDIFYSSFTNTNIAYLAANVGTSLNDNLYTVNLTTGTATLVGAIGLGLQVKDISAVINRTVPGSTSSSILYGLTRTNRNLVSFEANNPGLIRTIMTVTGVTTGQLLVGMDFRPKDRQLYAMGLNTTDSTYQIYRLNTTTGAATAVDTAKRKIALGTGHVGFDFNPTVDRIRVTSTNRRNYRLNPDNGTIAATDSTLRYAPGTADSSTAPFIGSVAYTNSFATAGTTTLYGIDDSGSRYVVINPPNNGVVMVLDTLGFTINALDRTTDLDFLYDSVAAINRGYLIANSTGSNNDNLYTITPGGVETLVGAVGNGLQLMDIAATIYFTGTPAAGIGQVAQQALKVYPSPASGTLNVVIPATAKGVTGMMVTDLAGRSSTLPYTLNGANNISIAVSSLSTGQYVVTMLTGDGQRYTARFVKQ